MSGLCEYTQLVLLDSHYVITSLFYFLLSSSECLNSTIERALT
jgi:hypothetical protein